MNPSQIQWPFDTRFSNEAITAAAATGFGLLGIVAYFRLKRSLAPLAQLNSNMAELLQHCKVHSELVRQMQASVGQSQQQLTTVSKLAQAISEEQSHHSGSNQQIQEYLQNITQLQSIIQSNLIQNQLQFSQQLQEASKMIVDAQKSGANHLITLLPPIDSGKARCAPEMQQQEKQISSEAAPLTADGALGQSTAGDAHLPQKTPQHAKQKQSTKDLPKPAKNVSSQQTEARETVPLNSVQIDKAKLKTYKLYQQIRQNSEVSSRNKKINKKITLSPKQ